MCSPRPSAPCASPALLPDPSALTIDSIAAQDGLIVFRVRTRAETAACPQCGRLAHRVHSRYPRTLSDLPWQGIPVQFQLTVPKFFCDNTACPQRIFAQRLASVTERYSRKTLRLSEALHLLVYRLGGETAAKVAQRLGLLLASPDTLLRQLRRGIARSTPTLSVRVLGVDDFALRRGQKYATILVDLERRCPVDLLPDRTSQTLQAWLREHPGVEIISRDRAGAYAEAADKAAPQAVQIADRWHLMKNAIDALEMVFKRERRLLKEAATQVHRQTTPEPSPPPPGSNQRVKAHHRERRIARWEHKMALIQAAADLERSGYRSRSEAAKALGISRTDFYRWLNRNTFVERKPLPRRERLIDPFAAYLRQRWDQGCHNGSTLFDEIVQQGFTGNYPMVTRFLQEWRQEWKLRRAREPAKVLSPRQATWLLLRSGEKSDKLTSTEQLLVQALIQQCPCAEQARELALSFFRLVRSRDVEALQRWRESAQESGIRSMADLSRGIGRDLAAVTAALSSPGSRWSNGQTEGQVNRLKMVKRQMYGRANLDLLRARVLPLPTHCPRPDGV
jgi:transposase